MESKDMSQYFKSITDQNQCPVVICNVEHEIIYMNPAAVVRYAKRGGAAITLPCFEIPCGTGWERSGSRCGKPC